jgi:hypothetical protein
MTAAPDSRRFPFFSFVLVLACAALAALVVILSRQNRELKATVAAMDQAMRRSEDALKPGQRLTSLTSVDSAGAEVLVPLGATGRRLVLIASTQCHACESVRPYWRELGQWASSANIETTCLLTDGPPKPEDAGVLLMPVLGVRSFRESSIAKLPTVPAVLLVRDGVVEHIWPGPYDATGRDEIMSALASP